MAANPDGVLERAMTQWGDGRVYVRPDETHAIASRLMGWVNSAETCKSCLSAEARSIIGGLALCPMCRDNREARAEGVQRLDRVVESRGESASGAGFEG